MRTANDAWESLLEAHSSLLREFRAEDIWTDLSMREYDVLYTLAKAGRPIRIGELHSHVLLSQPALSRMVDRLAGRGLLRRSTDPSDARAVLLSLTDAGAELQREVGRRHARHVAKALTDRLDPAALTQLESLCRQLTTRHFEPQENQK